MRVGKRRQIHLHHVYVYTGVIVWVCMVPCLRGAQTYYNCLLGADIRFPTLLIEKHRYEGVNGRRVETCYSPC